MVLSNTAGISSRGSSAGSSVTSSVVGTGSCAAVVSSVVLSTSVVSSAAVSSVIMTFSVSDVDMTVSFGSADGSGVTTCSDDVSTFTSGFSVDGSVLPEIKFFPARKITPAPINAIPATQTGSSFFPGFFTGSWPPVPVSPLGAGSGSGAVLYKAFSKPFKSGYLSVAFRDMALSSAVFIPDGRSGISVLGASRGSGSSIRFTEGQGVFPVTQ